MNVKEKHKLRKFIKELEAVRGRHTELVSVYVPAGYELIKIIQHLEQESGTASNIKDARTRKNVIDSLERAIRHLRLFKRTPDNGLAVFAGNASEAENKIDIKVWSIEPPDPLNFRLYRCDQTFMLDPLKDMLEHKEVYGLIVVDKREGNIGLLKGHAITELRELTSGVPGKFKTGGQCISEDTLVMKDNGELIEIKKSHNPMTIISENFNIEKSEETPIVSKWENKKELFKVITCYPKFEIKASADHVFFVRTENGIEEKRLSDINAGAYLLLPEKINLNLKEQPLDFVPEVKYQFNMKKINLPKILTPEIAQLFGYYLGDGSYEIDRLTFFEQREEVAIYYKNLIEKLFNVKCDLRFRKDKNYYQLRVYSRIITQLFKKYFNYKDKTMKGKIPSIILKSPDDVLAAFVKGFFDAEGYVSSTTRVALGINNKYIQRQLQLSLLRLGIISSILEYDNRRNPYSKNFRYTLAVDDKESLEKYEKLVGFSSQEKSKKLKYIITKRSNRNKVRQIVVNGKEIAKILRNSGYSTFKLMNSQFFLNKRQLNKEIFKKRILDNITDEDLKKRLYFFYDSNLIVAKISKITSIGVGKTIDIETKNHNFLANGLIVHNSSQRLERLREGMAKDFFVRIGEAANSIFLEMKENLKGIIIGGPGMTKEEFLAGHYLNNELKRKVIGVKDLSYTGEFGLNELVDKSDDLLAKEGIMEEKKIMTKFFEMLGKEPGKVSYGKTEVAKVLEMSAVDKLLLSESLPDEEIEMWEEKAEQYGTDVVVISIETREGAQLKELGGIAAILRYALR
ncbi:hypothetical protein HYX19_02795 [Candidatus Woesearchaeota archaeon]|nr:hypothetical protein [Candidatus Woesearchaeota archaeon]